MGVRGNAVPGETDEAVDFSVEVGEQANTGIRTVVFVEGTRRENSFDLLNLDHVTEFTMCGTEWSEKF